MVQVRYLNYIALRDKLKRLSKSEKVIGSSYSALATLVFDTALKNNGYLRKEAYYGSSFEQPGMTYKDWIEQLKKAGIFENFKDESLTFQRSDWIRFKPGPLTLSYVNKEKISTKEMASMDDLSKFESRISDELESFKKEIKDMTSKIEEYLKPPITEQNADKATKISQEINKKTSYFGQKHPI